MTKDLKEFLQKAGTDDNLAKEFESLRNEEDKNKVITKTIELAKSAGYTLTEADFEETPGELDDEELKAVSGGGICSCFVGGGGDPYMRDGVCACIIGGSGDIVEGEPRCVCALYGHGNTTNL